MFRSITALCLVAFAAPAAIAQDLDRDGLDDAFEQQLIERFAPRFKLSGSDCDVMPSEFQPGSVEPISVARNGTIYARAFKVQPARREGHWIELHYYHLWANDCGRLGHKYDIEHVAALVEARRAGDSPAKWRAAYWYAAAHEGTVCDAGNGGKASSLDAEERGPVVWISSGKHASFLSERMCKWGCGGDRCENITWLAVPRIVNIGEAAAPLNGAVWIDSPAWALASKLSSDFSPAMLAQLDHPKRTTAVSTNDALPPLKAVILSGGRTIDSLALSNRKTGAALSLAGGETDNALTVAAERTENAVAGAAHKTGSSLKRSAGAVGRFLGAKKKPPEDQTAK